MVCNNLILPCILVNVVSPNPNKLEIGSKTWLKNFEIDIRIFTTSDGLRLDLSDWLLDKLENDIDYFVYAIGEGEVSAKTLSGKIVIRTIIRSEKELTNIGNLEKEDRYRHIISFRGYVSTV